MSKPGKKFKRRRELPNILITGTPGTGKSLLAKKVASKIKYEWFNIGEMAKEHDCFKSYDEIHCCHVLDEEKILDVLEDCVPVGGKVLDFHGCDFFPEQWIDIVIVLTVQTDVLYDRLEKRQYNKTKIENNIQCEIFRMLLEEAYNSYKRKIVHEFPSNTEEDLAKNVEKIVELIELWKKSN